VEVAVPIIGHFAVGLLAGQILNRNAGVPARRAFMAGVALSVAPDFDLLAVPFGVSEFSPWAHRAAFHSLAAAVVVSMIFAAAAGRYWRISPPWLGLWALLTAISHGLLDLLTEGSRVALLWPFQSGWIHIGWRPLPGVDNPSRLLSWEVIPALGMEALVFSPLAFWVWWARRSGRGSKSHSDA
jgi:membrane-bound metal-dependent hydrolase YbcI (DUF457 family)